MQVLKHEFSRKANRTSWTMQNDLQLEISKKALRSLRALREIKKDLRTTAGLIARIGIKRNQSGILA